MEFRDINNMTDYSNPLPYEAVKINGQFLDEVLEGFTTISVSGRETVHLNLRTTGNLSGRDGEIFLGSDLPSRLISIKYLLKGSNASEFQQRFDVLKSLLFSNRLSKEIGFNDEEWNYFGYPTLINEIDDGLLEVVGSFEVLCVNPYKYSNVVTQTGSSITIGEANSLNYPIEIEEISFIPSNATSKITILNNRTGNRIVMNGNYLENQSIKFEFGLSPKIMQDTNDITKQLSFEVSSFPQFEIINNDVISVQDALGELSIKYRSKRL